MSTRGGRESPVAYVNFSEGFATKIKEAMAIKNGMIDRDGNVNVNAGGGGYYTEDGKFVNANGQVQAGGSLSNGIQYLLGLKNSGIKLPENLKKRLLKSLNTQVINRTFSLQQREQMAKQFGYASWGQAQNDINKAMGDTDSWSMADVTEDVVDDVIESVEDFEIDDAGGVGDWEPPGPKPHWDWMGAPGTGTTEPEETGGGEGWEPSKSVKKPVKSGYEIRKEAAKKGEVKRQARDILRKGKETPTGTGQLLGSAFDRDTERVGGKSYTQSKIEEAARTGKYTGF